MSDATFRRRLGARLRARRIELGKSQEDVADALGLMRASVSNIEGGRQRLHAHQVATLARYLDVSADDLLGLGPGTRAIGACVGCAVHKTAAARANARLRRVATAARRCEVLARQVAEAARAAAQEDDRGT